MLYESGGKSKYKKKPKLSTTNNVCSSKKTLRKVCMFYDIYIFILCLLNS